VELLLNGSSKEKEQTASWLRWIHQHIEGSISAEMRKELGIPEEIEKYGYMNELKVHLLHPSSFRANSTLDQAYIMQTLTWAVISFQDRFGQRYEICSATLKGVSYFQVVGSGKGHNSPGIYMCWDEAG
jgi:hypothetical protein